MSRYDKIYSGENDSIKRLSLSLIKQIYIGERYCDKKHFHVTYMNKFTVLRMIVLRDFALSLK